MSKWRHSKGAQYGAMETSVPILDCEQKPKVTMVTESPDASNFPRSLDEKLERIVPECHPRPPSPLSPHGLNR